jgi:hypothetical protein
MKYFLALGAFASLSLQKGNEGLHFPSCSPLCGRARRAPKTANRLKSSGGIEGGSIPR